MRLATIAVLLIFQSPPFYAQTARQGSERADSTEFRSPMILDAPFVAADPVNWNLQKGAGVTSAAFSELGRFRCEGVSMRFGPLYPRIMPENQVATRLEFNVINPGHDKFVKLLFELLNGDSKIAEAALQPFKVKEGATAHQQALIVAPKAELRTDPLTVIRITMTTWDY